MESFARHIGTACLFVGLLGTGLEAQTPTTPKQPQAAKSAATAKPAGITNQDVIDLVKAGATDQFILSYLATQQERALDLTPRGVVALKVAGVSERVLSAMLGQPVENTAQVTTLPAVKAAPTTSNPASDGDDNSPHSGTLGKLGSTIKQRTVAAVSGLVGNDGSNSTAATNSSGQTPTKLRDGEPAIIQTALSAADATAKTKAFFTGKNVDFTVNPNSGRIISDWYGERRCGPGFYRCANRASVQVTVEAGKTVVRIQVTERKREAGINDKPWNENSTSKGPETAALAAELELAFAKGR